MKKKSTISANTAPAKPKRNKLEKIGSIRVESGMVWISDPSSIIGGDGDQPMFANWSDFLHKNGFSHGDQAKHERCIVAHQEGRPITDDMRVGQMPAINSQPDNAGMSIRTTFWRRAVRCPCEA
jgi:hypothetical protein